MELFEHKLTVQNTWLLVFKKERKKEKIETVETVESVHEVKLYNVILIS